MSTAFLLAILVVSFVAGVVALAMPCCFTVLLPAYLATSFETTTGRLAMTAIFAAGIATVFLPIAVGVSYVAAFIATNRAVLFVVGGFFMVILGLLALYGLSIFPHANFGIDLSRRDFPSVYALGVFGGVASSCCAPVLAGVLVLAALSATWSSALIVGGAYVLGMVFPLFLVALAWERGAERSPGLLRGRMVHIRLLGHEMEIHSSRLIAGGLFLVMGVLTIALGVLDQMFVNPGAALFEAYESGLQGELVAAFSSPLVQVALGAIATAVAAWAVLRLRSRRLQSREAGPDSASADPLDP